MAANTRKPESNSQSAQRRRRKRRGVPAALTAALVIVALFFGGLAGVFIEKRTSPYADELAEAKAHINELENTLTMIGFNVNTDDANEWVFDSTGMEDEVSDLTGDSVQNDNAELLWGEDNLLTGMMQDTADPVVVAEFDGGSVLSSEVVDPYNDELATYVFAGYNASDVAESVLNDVLQYLVSDKILYVRATELGLTDITEEDRTAIAAEAQANLDEQVEYYLDIVAEDGMTSAEKREAAIAYLEDELGITLDSIAGEVEETWWTQKLFDYVTKDVSVSDDEIQTAYQEMLTQQQSDFTQFPEEFEYALMNGQAIVYNLEGYRAVKHIFLPFEDSADEEEAQRLLDAIALLNPETDMTQIGEYQDQLDALYTDLEAQAETVLNELNQGADFDALIEKYGQDEDMLTEPTKSNGFYVSADSIRWSGDFVEGCMMLEEVGQVSTPVRSVGGIHIIKYIGDVAPGAVALEDVRDAIAADVLLARQSEVYDAQVAEWLSGANVTYYPERLQ